MISDYINQFAFQLPEIKDQMPWNIVGNTESIILKKIETLGSDFTIENNIAIHKSAKIEQHVVLKGPAIISANCFIGAHAYLRGGVILGEMTSVGPGCEVKSSLLLGCALAHFNFVGDSILGEGVNMEAGSVIANYFNERNDKSIYVRINGGKILTGVSKFGALVGDHTKIGANAVLSPGTILQRHSVVKRLELVDQSQ